MRQVLLAGEESNERTALPGYLVAQGSAQHWVKGFELIEDGVLRCRAIDF
jgi:hypothetical protein